MFPKSGNKLLVGSANCLKKLQRLPFNTYFYNDRIAKSLERITCYLEGVISQVEDHEENKISFRIFKLVGIFKASQRTF